MTEPRDKAGLDKARAAILEVLEEWQDFKGTDRPTLAAMCAKAAERALVPSSVSDGQGSDSLPGPEPSPTLSAPDALGPGPRSVLQKALDTANHLPDDGGASAILAQAIVDVLAALPAHEEQVDLEEIKRRFDMLARYIIAEHLNAKGATSGTTVSFWAAQASWILRLLGLPEPDRQALSSSPPSTPEGLTEELWQLVQRMDELALTADQGRSWRELFVQVRQELNERLGKLRSLLPTSQEEKRCESCGGPRHTGLCDADRQREFLQDRKRRYHESRMKATRKRGRP